jgi:hypothetical protein
MKLFVFIDIAIAMMTSLVNSIRMRNFLLDCVGAIQIEVKIQLRAEAKKIIFAKSHQIQNT